MDRSVCCIWNCQVQATHKYVGEDLDELTFEPGEIVTVVPFDDPEEQVHTTVNFMHASCFVTCIYVNYISLKFYQIKFILLKNSMNIRNNNSEQEQQGWGSTDSCPR